MNWNGLDQWQLWLLGIGGSLIAAFLIWLGKRFFGSERGTGPRLTIQQTVSPVQSQTFQPTINIHPTIAVPLQQPASPTPQAPAHHAGADSGPARGDTNEQQERPEAGTPLQQRPSVPHSGEQAGNLGNFGVQITPHSPDPESYGLVISLANHRLTNVNRCCLWVREARSVDARHSQLRESFGFQAIVLNLPVTLLAGDETRGFWLVRVTGNHLEVGDSVGQGILPWPQADKSKRQVWVLSLSVEEDRSTLVTFEVTLSWARGTDLPTVLHVQPLGPPVQASGQMPLAAEDGVLWRLVGDTRSGPYCPTCFEADGKTISLIAGATRGTYTCPVHGTPFWTEALRRRNEHSL